MLPSVDQILRKARRHAKQGETELAAQQFRLILEKYPQNQSAIKGLKAIRSDAAPQAQIDTLNAMLEQERHLEAIDYGLALEKEFPNTLAIPHMLGAVYFNLGRFPEAAASFNRALQLDPDNAEILNSLGASQMNLGKLDDASASLTKALELKPDLAFARCNLGIVYRIIGRLDEAVSNFLAAIEIQPDYAAAHNNLGVVLQQLGRSEEAIASYSKSLQLDESNAEAHNNLGVLLNECGKVKEALIHFNQSISLSPGNKAFWNNFFVPLHTLKTNNYNQQLADIYLALLDQETVARPSQLVKPIIGLVNQNPAIKHTFRLLDDGDVAVTEICKQLADTPLLLRIITLCPIPDPNIERLLRILRQALLVNCRVVPDGPEVRKTQSALALYCFTNEYILGETAEESPLVNALENDIATSFDAQDTPDPIKIACLASYRPLHHYNWARQIAAPQNLEELFSRQIKLVDEETSIRANIRSFGQSDNQVSESVRAQYEENPYPRWINTALHTQARSIPDIVNALNFKLIDPAWKFSDHPEILVAGCGTGQQALSTATRFANCKVLAIDLSLSSLSYATRKTRQLGISNIDYMQADILDLDNMDKQFDLIECAGVLHHMAEPLAGWKILTELLKPGGLMKIGLYSELARKSVVEIREKIAEMGLLPNTDNILKLRAEALNSDAEVFTKIKRFRDFNSTSELRDLLFHVQEHRFSLPQIKNNLEVLGLNFAGFEFVDISRLNLFKQANPEPQALYCLDTWHQFELENPNTFAGMYQFWLQKNPSQ